ncbi:MAG: ABC transporter substrate-binding protein [Chloroflexi bacterium]|nr:ABC transporter substrate-binding protein [Chloroflexota bacterium]
MSRIIRGPLVIPCVVVSMLALGMLAACTSTPTPTPTKAPAAPTKAAAPVATAAPAPAATKAAQPAATKAAEPTKPAAVAPAQPLANVKLGYTQSLQYSPIYVADARGYFKEQGISLSFERTTGGAEQTAFLTTGEVDIIGGGLSAGFFNALARGVIVRIVGPLAFEPPVGGGSTSPMIVRKALLDSGAVKSPKDLKGKNVALNVRFGLTEYRLYNVLKEAGLRLEDVEITTMPFPDSVLAMRNGAIDVVMVPMPFSGEILSSGIGAVLVPETLPGKMTLALQYGPKFIQERPDVARKFMVAYLKGSRDVQGQDLLKPEILDIILKATNQKPDSVQAGTLPVFDPDGTIHADWIDDQQQFFRDIGKLDYQEPIPSSKIIDDTFVKYALQQLGPYKK